MENLLSLLEKGYYKDNLVDLVSLCEKSLKFNNKHTLVIFSLKCIFDDMYNTFEGGPVDVDLHNKLTYNLTNSITKLITNIETDSESVQYCHLNEIITQYYKNKKAF